MVDYASNYREKCSQYPSAFELSQHGAMNGYDAYETARWAYENSGGDVLEACYRLKTESSNFELTKQILKKKRKK